MAIIKLSSLLDFFRDNENDLACGLKVQIIKDIDVTALFFLWPDPAVGEDFEVIEMGLKDTFHEMDIIEKLNPKVVYADDFKAKLFRGMGFLKILNYIFKNKIPNSVVMYDAVDGRALCVSINISKEGVATINRSRLLKGPKHHFNKDTKIFVKKVIEMVKA